MIAILRIIVQSYMASLHVLGNHNRYATAPSTEYTSLSTTTTVKSCLSGP